MQTISNWHTTISHFQMYSIYYILAYCSNTYVYTDRTASMLDLNTNKSVRGQQSLIIRKRTLKCKGKLHGATVLCLKDSYYPH